MFPVHVPVLLNVCEAARENPVLSLTVAEMPVTLLPALVAVHAPVKVVVPLTSKAFDTVKALNVTVPLTPSVDPSDTAPDNVVAFVTVRAFSVVVPDVDNVPVIVTLPVPIAPVLIAAKVAVPVTPNVLPRETAPLNVVALVTVKAFSVVVPLVESVPVMVTLPVPIAPVFTAARVVVPVTPNVEPKDTAPVCVVVPETVIAFVTVNALKVVVPVVAKVDENSTAPVTVSVDCKATAPLAVSVVQENAPSDVEVVTAKVDWNATAPLAVIVVADNAAREVDVVTANVL